MVGNDLSICEDDDEEEHEGEGMGILITRIGISQYTEI
jgi:hypothetical protein